MLISILVTFLLAFGLSSSADPTVHYIEQMKHAVKKDVIAKDQRDIVLSVVDEMQKAAKSNSDKVHKARKSLERLLTEKRVVARTEFTSVLDELGAQRTQQQDQTLRYRAKLKKHLDRQTWQKVFAEVDKSE